MWTILTAMGVAHAGAWTTGTVDDLTGPGLTESYVTDPLVVGYDAELRVVYGLWNSPEVWLDVSFDGVLLGTLVADPSNSWLDPGPATGVFDVTALVTDQPATIDIVSVPPGPFLYGEAVIGSVTVVWDSDDDADGVTGLTDCDDADPEVFPGAEERCNLVDDDCDGEVDGPDPVDPVALFLDADVDGFGDPTVPVVGCPGEPGTAITGDDCDDNNVLVYPGAAETCGEPDLDCDGDPDAGAIDAAVFTRDDDSDGFGGAFDEVSACTAPVGFGPPGDCDDAVAETFPGADESCNGVDDDCDGSADEDPVDAVTLYLDGDEDGIGGFAAIDGCPGAEGTSEAGGDCNDLDPDVFPGAVERCDGVDDDCDGVADDDAVDTVPSWADADGDGWGDPEVPGVACPNDAAWAPVADDCDDADPAVHPDAEERCNAIDDDCDGLVDDDAVDCDDADPTVPADAGEKPLDAAGCGCSGSAPWGGWAALVGITAAARRRRRTA